MSSEIKADKWSPASGTSATIGDSGDTYTIPSGVTLNTSSATLTLPSTVITGQTAKTSLVDADKFLISDSAASGALKYVEKQYLPSGALVSLASSDSGSDVANVVFDNVFSDTYSRYIIYIDNIFNVNGGEVLRYKYRKSDGSGGYEDETRTGYTYTVRFIKSGNSEENTSANSGGAQTYGNLTTGIQNSTGEHGFKAIINVYRPSTRQSSQATMTYVTCNGTYRAYSGDSTMSGILSSASNNYHTDAFLGIKLYFSAGNVDDHKIRVYGVIT